MLSMTNQPVCAQCSAPLPPLPIDVRGLDPWSGEYRTRTVCSKACARMLKAAGEELAPSEAPNVDVEVEFREELPA